MTKIKTFKLNLKICDFGTKGMSSRYYITDDFTNSGKIYIYIDNPKVIKQMVDLTRAEGKFKGINWENDITARCYQAESGILMMHSFEAHHIEHREDIPF